MMKIAVMVFVVLFFQICKSGEISTDSLNNQIMHYSNLNHNCSITMSVGAILIMTSLTCFVINEKFHDGSNKIYSNFGLVTGTIGPLIFWPSIITFTFSEHKLKHYLNVKIMNHL
jgi:hypothetical protein